VGEFNDGETFFAGHGGFSHFHQTFQLGTTAKTLYFSQWGKALLGPDLQTDRWYHIAATSVGTSVTLYLNGGPVATGTLNIDTPSGTRFIVGSLPDDKSKRMNGLIDKIAVYDRALWPEEIRAIYSAGRDGEMQVSHRASRGESPRGIRPRVSPRDSSLKLTRGRAATAACLAGVCALESGGVARPGGLHRSRPPGCCIATGRSRE